MHGGQVAELAGNVGVRYVSEERLILRPFFSLLFSSSSSG